MRPGRLPAILGERSETRVCVRRVVTVAAMTAGRRHVAAGATALCLLAACASAAQAAVVKTARTETAAMDFSNPKTGPDMRPAMTTYVLSIEAGPGETNAIAIERGGGAIVVRDAVAVTPGEGCQLADATTARCPTPSTNGGIVEQRIGGITLGDGDDSFHSGPPPTYVFDSIKIDAGSGDDDVSSGSGSAVGGPGNDRLTADIADGGPGDDVIAADGGDGGEGNDVLGPPAGARDVKLAGGAGDDVLTGSGYSAGDGDTLDGGVGNDRLSAGDGDDILQAGPGADVIDGGGGTDQVSFAYATAPVRVDLALADATDPAGEGDAMTGIEDVEGTAGDDVLLGSGTSNVLIGGPGNDRIAGRSGDDLLVGGDGADAIDGDDGGDAMASAGASYTRDRRELERYTSDSATDALSGGPGADVLHIGTGDAGKAGAGSDLLVAGGRPAVTSCGTGNRDRFDGERVPRNCDRVVLFGSDSMPARLGLRRWVVTARVPHFLDDPITVVLRVGSRVLGRVRASIGFGTSRTYRFPIARRHRALLRSARTVRLSFATSDGIDAVRDSVVLQAPR